MKTIETLDPKAFRGLITTIGELPSSFVDSMSYYEMIAWLVDYIKKNVIPAINNNAEAIKEIQKWIETLDLQDEVDNKLDEMAASGELAEIISQYLNSTAVFAYDNVASMKAAENLINGSYARTLGYYAKNDGGAGLYKIRNITNDDVVDEASIIEMGDGSDNLIAELIFTDSIDLMQFGCKGTGTDDDTNNVQKAVTFAEAKDVLLTSRGDKTYKVTSPINVVTLKCNLNDATITTPDNINIFYINSTTYYGDIEHITFDCTNANAGIYINNGRKKTFKNLIFNNISHYGFYYNAGYEILLADSHFNGNGQKNNVGVYLNSSDSRFENLIMIDCHTAVFNHGLNFFDGLHAWIYTKAIVEDSIFANLDSNRAYFNQCYSDTYGKTFYCNGGSFIANELQVFLNDSIWEATLSKPYLAYFADSSKVNVANTVTNSRVYGVRSTQQLIWSNVTPSMIKATNNSRVWCQDVSGVETTLTGYGENVTEVYTNKVTLDAGIVTVDFEAEVDCTQSINVNFSNLDEIFRPISIFSATCQHGANRYSRGTQGYLYVGNNIQSQCTEGTGTRYLKIHTVYKSGYVGNV